jgi:UDP-N-acetylglucosamine--N-acetylmuramyl-(pentapeptide) pyrophosphoryl-undecaprenol N-acetylglucosamine transferase
LFLVVTGGGTGGHVYPALEVARLARERGADLLYLGSLRGQESGVCGRESIEFQGFPSQPLYSLRTPRGWKAAVSLLRATSMARSALRRRRPDAVFSTGGYSAAPVMAAARSLGIPYNIHEANSVPGRSNLMFAERAFAFTSTFRSTEGFAKGREVIRTGQPIRRELRALASQPRTEGPTSIIIIGGSQGAVYLNENVPDAAREMSDDQVTWTHASGKSHYDKTVAHARELGLGANYRVEPYLETDAIAAAYRSATMAIARSGGTLAEFALFRLPSVLVPLPTSADDHQLHNAIEFADMNAATVLRQESTDPIKIAEAVRVWIDDTSARARAEKALADWDRPDATERIVELVERAARGRK